MINDEADEFIKELFKSLKNRYQNNLGQTGPSEGSSCVAFETLIINSQIDFINLFIDLMSKLFNAKSAAVWHLSQVEENDCLWTCILRFGF